jgi:glycosyltransferase involved in cell wall biosynthesis
MATARARAGDARRSAVARCAEIVSDTDDLPFVTAPKGGIVLGSTDVERWADALTALYENPAQMARMGVHAERFVREEHSPDANARAREQVYLGERARSV